MNTIETLFEDINNEFTYYARNKPVYLEFAWRLANMIAAALVKIGKYGFRIAAVGKISSITLLGQAQR